MIISRVLKIMRVTNLLPQKLLLVVVFVLLTVSSFSSHAVTFKIATLSPEGTGWMKALRGAAKKIGERTDGAVKFKIYPGGVMGDDKAVLRKMRIGQLHGAALTSGGVMQPYPDLSLIHISEPTRPY